PVAAGDRDVPDDTAHLFDQVFLDLNIEPMGRYPERGDLVAVLFLTRARPLDPEGSERLGCFVLFNRNSEELGEAPERKRNLGALGASWPEIDAVADDLAACDVRENPGRRVESRRDPFGIDALHEPIGGVARDAERAR